MVHFSYIIIETLSSFHSTDDLRRTMAFLKEVGYEGVEVNLTKPLGVDEVRFKQWIEEAGLVMPSFLTGDAYREGICLCSPDKSVRARATQRLIEYLDTAKLFNAFIVVGLLQGLRKDEPDSRAANPRIIECLREVAVAAEKKGVEVVIEPVNHLQVGFNNSVAEVNRLIQAVKSPAIKPMVDTIHMNIEERSLVQPVLDCGSNLRHVHLCESNGALFGTGHIDFRSMLNALDAIGYDRFASVKVYRNATREEAARNSIMYLRTLRGLKP